MSQNRKPPAYQEYAADFLSNRVFRLLSLEQRGLLQTMRLECWVNSQVPSQPADLAKYLGLTPEEVRRGLSEGVKSYFVERDGSFYCIELEDYRRHLADRRMKQSMGGAKGADKTNRMRYIYAKRMEVDDSITPSSKARPSRRGGVECLVKPTSEQQSQNQSLKKGVVDEEFVKAFEAEENCLAEEYLRASRGG